MSNRDSKRNVGGPGIENCEIPIDTEQQYELVIPRVASGNAPVLIEIICERVHCVLYDYAISTVDMIIDTYGDKVEIQTIIRRGEIGNAERFLELCERAGKMLSVPAILINGEVAFDSVPHPDELKKAIEAVLDRQK
jgi:hypothetical protein